MTYKRKDFFPECSVVYREPLDENTLTVDCLSLRAFALFLIGSRKFLCFVEHHGLKLPKRVWPIDNRL